MALYLISYDLKIPGRDYSGLYASIKSFGTWCHPTDSTWIIKTDNRATAIYNTLKPKIDTSDYLLIVKFDPSDYYGWLSKSIWEWIKINA